MAAGRHFGLYLRLVEFSGPSGSRVSADNSSEEPFSMFANPTLVLFLVTSVVPGFQWVELLLLQACLGILGVFYFHNRQNFTQPARVLMGQASVSMLFVTDTNFVGMLLQIE